MKLKCPECLATDKEVLYCHDCNKLNTCTKCKSMVIEKEHLCEDCYTAHNEWLKDLVSGTMTVKGGIEIDTDGYYTLYESGDE